MARPIKETPILTGEDARRFVKRMRMVENLPREQREENTRRLKIAVEEAKKIITVRI